MTTTEPRLASEPAVAEPDPGLSIRPRLRHDALFADTGDGVLPEPPVSEALRTRFSAQLNYLDDAVRRFLDFQSTRVLVLGPARAGLDPDALTHLATAVPWRDMGDRDA